MKITITRNEVPLFLQVLRSIKGLKDYKKGIPLVADKRKLEKIQEESEDLVKMCKPAGYDELQKEFTELKGKKARQFTDVEGELLNQDAIGSHVMLVWPKAKDWTDLNMDYQKEIEKIGKQEIEIDFQTKLDVEFFDKKNMDMSTLEVRSYFLKKVE